MQPWPRLVCTHVLLKIMIGYIEMIRTRCKKLEGEWDLSIYPVLVHPMGIQHCRNILVFIDWNWNLVHTFHSSLLTYSVIEKKNQATTKLKIHMEYRNLTTTQYIWMVRIMSSEVSYPVLIHSWSWMKFMRPYKWFTILVTRLFESGGPSRNWRHWSWWRSQDIRRTR